jgi:protein-disulfide isomerase
MGTEPPSASTKGKPLGSTFRDRWRFVLDTLGTLAFIAVSATIVWATISERRTASAPPAPGARQSRKEPAPPTTPVSLDTAVIQGSRTAKVAVIEFSDFQCPYCGKFARETLPGLEAKYVKSGQVLFAFQPLPLPMHAFAEKAAEAAECAGRQGRFWEMHDSLFRNQEALDEPHLHERATDVHLDRAQFDTCLAGQAGGRVQQSAALGKTLTISGTPTFFLGTVQSDGKVKVTQRFTGAMPTAQLSTALDHLLTVTK